MAPGLVEERTTLAVQGGYYVVTGVAPFVSRRAFEAVTGPKTEWWLVQTVGAIVTAVGAVLISGARSGRITPELRGLAAGCAVGLAAIDTVYVARRRIAPTYLLDAGVQLGALAALSARARRRPSP
jgi:hypothetical protein